MVGLGGDAALGHKDALTFWRRPFRAHRRRREGRGPRRAGRGLRCVRRRIRARRTHGRSGADKATRRGAWGNQHHAPRLHRRAVACARHHCLPWRGRHARPSAVAAACRPQRDVAHNELLGVLLRAVLCVPPLDACGRRGLGGLDMFLLFLRESCGVHRTRRASSPRPRACALRRVFAGRKSRASTRASIFLHQKENAPCVSSARCCVSDTTYRRRRLELAQLLGPALLQQRLGEAVGHIPQVVHGCISQSAYHSGAVGPLRKLRYVPRRHSAVRGGRRSIVVGRAYHVATKTPRRPCRRHSARPMHGARRGWRRRSVARGRVRGSSAETRRRHQEE